MPVAAKAEPSNNDAMKQAAGTPLRSTDPSLLDNVQSPGAETELVHVRAELLCDIHEEVSDRGFLPGDLVPVALVEAGAPADEQRRHVDAVVQISLAHAAAPPKDGGL